MKRKTGNECPLGAMLDGARVRDRAVRAEHLRLARAGDCQFSCRCRVRRACPEAPQSFRAGRIPAGFFEPLKTSPEHPLSRTAGYAVNCALPA